ncbi:uncharacterized protein LOC128261261 [Drosophila gunungcola]|uniref:uncharacterized protein LOC128261261 n=1 Tax=Drosophila gunungcola TaxID=103775 RepID=UPI0022E946F0|nr:uncharacterized protein LOC128261261 [Drosophila gunungcola]
MGAEQSALLVCTQTGKPEKPLELVNSELFFRLHFENMREPVTGPVTQALLHLAENLQRTRQNVNGDHNMDFNEESESGFNSDYSEECEVSSLTLSTGTDSDVEIEPLQIAEFDSMDEDDMPNPEFDEPHADELPIFESHE